jgi:hypothetical protein
MEVDDCNGRGTCNLLGNCECDPIWTGYLDCTYCKLVNFSGVDLVIHFVTVINVRKVQSTMLSLLAHVCRSAYYISVNKTGWQLSGDVH